MFSGFDDLKVQYNSAKPAQSQTNAFTQGSDIHIASGKDKLLGHETTHVVQQNQGLKNIDFTFSSFLSSKTTSDAAKSYSQEEITGLAKHLNYCLNDDSKLKYLMPINPNNLDLLKKVADGVLIARFINMIEPDTIDWRVINYKEKGGLDQYHMTQNQRLNIAAAKSIGLRITNLCAADLCDAVKNPNLTLGFLWEAVKMRLLKTVNLKSHSELITLLDADESIYDLLALSPEEILKKWVNHHLEQQEYKKRINNFSSDIKDGKVYTFLLKAITVNNENKVNNMDALKWDATKRVNYIIESSKKMGIKPFLTGKDILNGNNKLNMSFVAQLFNINPMLKQEANVVDEKEKELAGLLKDDESDNREERIFKIWINSLDIKDVNVNNLYEDCRSGLVLLKVIDQIEPGSVKWKQKVEIKPNNKSKRINNTNYAIDLGKNIKLRLENINGSDITDRNKKRILNFIWELMRYYLLKLIASSSIDGKQVTDKDIISFCNTSIMKSDLNKKPQIKSFNDDTISSGMYFISLIASIEPDIVNWQFVTDGKSDKDKQLNAKYVISLARKMGLMMLLLSDDIIEVKHKMCMVFCAVIMAEAYKRSAKVKK